MLLSLLIILLIASECNRRREKKLAQNNLVTANSAVAYYKNKLGTQTATINTLQLDKTDLQKVIIEKNSDIDALSKEFTSVKSVVKFHQVIKFDTIYVPFMEQIPVKFTRNDSVTTKYYSFGYKVDSTGMALQNFTIPNETTILTGYKRKWLLGRQTLTTDITNSNPYIKVEGITSAEVIIPEPWYKKWYLWLAAGIAAGALVK